MPRRRPVTVTVLSNGDTKTTRRFLAELSTVTNRRDNVFVVQSRGPATHGTWYTKDSAGEFRAAAHAKVSLPQTQRPQTPRPVVIFVDDRVVGSGRWIDRLVELLDEQDVGAVAPRTNFAEGEELLIGVPYRPYEPSVRDEYLRAHSGKARLSAAKVGRLRGPCIATTLRVLGGTDGFFDVAKHFDPASVVAAARISRKLVLVAEDVYLHHPGGRLLTSDPKQVGYPLISACLIVKDEEHNIDLCLASIAGLVDEIVVYDTGSTDATMEIANLHNPILVRGYWDDDFARARNDALAHCSGQWILWIDADEALECDDHDGLRRRLRTASTEIEGITVLIDNLRGHTASTSLTHPACRLFRRAIGNWQGTIHEQIIARRGSEMMAIATAPLLADIVRIKHWGYLQSELVGKHKGERNIRTAFGDLAGRSDLGIAERVLSLGRSHLLVGKVNSGIDLCRLAALLATYPPTLRFALRGTIEGLIAAGRFDEALELIEPLKRVDADKLAYSLAAAVHLAAGRPGDVLIALDQIDDGLDVDGFEYSANFLAGTRATALAALERYDEAAEVLLTCLREKGGIDAHLGLLIECMERSGHDLGTIYDTIGSKKLIEFAPQLLQIRPDAADQCLEAWFERACVTRTPNTDPPDIRIILAMGSSIAVRLDTDRRLVWSRRVRDGGFPGACPLVVAAASSLLSTEDRRLSAALAVSQFGDIRASLLHTALSHDSQVISNVSETFVDRTTKQDILIIARDVCDLGALALAAVLRGTGHEVTLIHPRPTDETFALLDPLHIGVHGWTEQPGTDWTKSCLHVVSCIYAARPVEVVLLCPGTELLADDLHRRLVVSQIVTDINQWLPASVADLFRRSDVPDLESRSGISIVANLRSADPASVSLFTSTVAPLLTRLSSDFPTVVFGDDPEMVMKQALPLAVQLGPQADPTRWVRSTRVLLIPFAHEASQWLRVAGHCGTPALVIPQDPQMAEPLVRAIEALLSNDAIWRTNAPSESITPLELAADPLEQVAPKRSAVPKSGGREVVLIGDVRSHASLARVNRELAFRLTADPRFNLKVREQSPIEIGNDTADRLREAKIELTEESIEPAIEIRHMWPPDFSPVKGRLVLILPWEFGSYPAEWVGPIRDSADEVWVPTNWVREGAIAAGVDPKRVHVVPNGVDTDVYQPTGPIRKLKTTKGTRFLFVGGLIDRKGIDVLLEVYLSNFTKSDDVCLVVKPFGTNSFYDVDVIEATLRRAAESDGPEIEIVDEDLDEASMASLYRSCTALVHPYRGEGFGLPIAEAMACGLPGIVTDGGACLDFCDESTSWLIDAQQIPMWIEEMTPSEGGSWWLEPSRLDLARTMKTVMNSPTEARARGQVGCLRIATQFTWDGAAQVAASRIVQLLDGTKPSPARNRSLTNRVYRRVQPIAMSQGELR